MGETFRNLRELLGGPSDYGELVHQSNQWDSLSLYYGKKKRFTLVRLQGRIPDSPHHRWVTEKALRAISTENHRVSVDLMAALALVFALDCNRGRGSRTGPRRLAGVEPLDPSSLEQLSIEDLVGELPSNSDLGLVRDSLGRQIQFVEYWSDSREVKTWIQPLLIESQPSISFVEKELAGYCQRCQRRATLLSGSRALKQQMLTTSAEGGRFYKHDVHIVFGSETDTGRNLTPECPYHSRDVGLEWASRRALSDLVTTLEFRLALFAKWVTFAP